MQSIEKWHPGVKKIGPNRFSSQKKKPGEMRPIITVSENVASRRVF